MPGQSIFAEGLEGLLAEGNVSRLPLQPRKRQKSAIVRIGREMVIGQATEWLSVRKWTVPFMVWTSPGLGIRSFTHSLFNLLLKITNFKERPKTICSHRSLQKSNRERFAHITLYKRAILSERAKSKCANEQIPNPGLVQTMKGIVHLFTKSHH